jgi:hypothetical protein
VLLANPSAALAIARLDRQELRVSHLEIEISERSQILIDTHPQMRSLAGSISNVTCMKWCAFLNPLLYHL